MKRPFLIVVCLMISGCATFNLNVVDAPTKKSTEIISEPPGADIEINNEYVGKTPLYVEISASRNIYGELLQEMIIIANPIEEGQYLQTKRVKVGMRTPKKIYFNMQLKPAPDEYSVDIK